MHYICRQKVGINTRLAHFLIKMTCGLASMIDTLTPVHRKANRPSGKMISGVQDGK